MLGLSAAFGGTLVERKGPRWAMFVSMVCFSSGFLLSALGVATRQYWDAPLGASDSVVLIFGRETGGLAPQIHETYRDRFVTMPIQSPLVRSLNLSTSVGIAVYEVLRQRRERA